VSGINTAVGVKRSQNIVIEGINTREKFFVLSADITCPIDTFVDFF
jgi:hypothetical protein